MKLSFLKPIIAVPSTCPSRFFPLFSKYIYCLVNDAWALTYTTLSVLRDFADDGVVYLELRTTPRAMPQAGLTKAQYVQTILDAIATFEAAETATGGPLRLRTRLILSVSLVNMTPPNPKR